MTGIIAAFDELAVMSDDLMGQLERSESRCAELLEAANRYMDSLAEFGNEEEGTYFVGDNMALDDLSDAIAKAEDLESTNDGIEDGLR